MIKYCLFLLLLFPVVSRAQELITSAYYPFAAIAVNSEMTLADPMAMDQSPATDYKVERRFRMELAYNRNNHTDRITATKWKLTVTVQNTVSLQSESLAVEFTPSGEAIYTAWADFTGNVSTMNWKVTAITIQKHNGTSWVAGALSDLPVQDIHLEAMVFNDRLVNLSTTASKLSLSSNLLSWDYVPGAVEYDVEWVFIDDEDDFTYNAGAPAAPFTFKEPVRITTFRHHHELDLIYPKGTLYFRVRPKGYQFRTGNREVYYSGGWSYAKKSGSGNMLLAITSDFEELKNWSYTVAYAENGMSMSQITYYDGALRARQQLSRMKSTGQVVAAGSLYDYEGRQTVQVIPTPVNANSISYYSHLHKDAGGGDFDKADFDLGVSNEMGTGAGAGRYYSSANNLTSDPFRDRIPDAEGYPYVQTEFTNDNTGRLKRSSGVGYAHRLGGGHETKYFYLKPTERDLRELFGKNVGNVSHYDKQVVVDPNGQASVTYTDQFGRVIASGLMNSAPSNLMPLDNNPAGTPVSTTADLMPMNQIISNNGSLESLTDYHHLNMGTNTVTLKYDMLSGGINSAEAIFGTGGCASCFYELEIKVYDPDGNLVDINYTSQTLGGLPMDYVYEKYAGSSFACTDPGFDPTTPGPVSHAVSLTQSGVYRMVKILRVDQAAVAAWLATNASTLPGAPDEELITHEYLSNIITSGCGFDCDAYFEQECREDLGYPITGLLSTAARDSVDACIGSKCLANIEEITNTTVPEADECNMIRGMFEQDLSPGGWVFEEDLAWRSTTTNWDMDYPTGGTPFNPSSWEDLINNWQPEWSATLFDAGKHPENCHHEKCVDLAVIKDYIQELHGVTTMAAAQSGLYLNSGANNDFWGSNDPLSSDPLYSSAFAAFINTINSNYSGTGDNIFEAVNDLITANPNLAEDANGNPLAGTALDDRKWLLMRNLYLGEREKFIEDNYNYSCNPVYYPHPSAHFVDPDEALDPFGDSFPAENCGDICVNNVSYWMSRIADECPSLDSLTLLEVQGHLQSYCIADCDGLANVAGAIQLSDLTTNTDLLAVDDILNHYCDFNLVSLAQDDTCAVRDTVVLHNVNETSLEFDQNVHVLYTISEPDASYLTFITQPAITGISGYASMFPLAHWQSGMQIRLTNTSTSTTTTYDISDIADIDPLATAISGLEIKTDVRVTLLDGTEHLHTINQFSLSYIGATRDNWFIFDIDSIAGKVTVEYTICADTTSPLDTDFSLEGWIDDCIGDIEEEATTLAEVLYAELLEDFLNGTAYSFSANCFGDGLSEQFSISYSKCEYAFTLYYYDQAGNLVQTVPPQGVHIVPPAGFNASGTWNGTTQPAHLMTSNYLFNAFNQPREVKTPDGDNTRFAYNRNQQLRASQHAEQQVANTQCNYLKYDALGRVIEAGVANVAWNVASGPVTDDAAWPKQLGLTGGTYTLTEVTRTSYHKRVLALDAALGWNPKDLNNRVAEVAYYDQINTASPAYINAIFYDYDIQGNVKRLLTDLNGTLGTQRYKTVDYAYDLYSGKVNRVVYQQEQEDQFIHRYVYDDDNRLTGVETSRDGIQWASDASYYYYLHGPLARTELGDDKVQGTDYAYTIHGWLKGVNSSTMVARRDMGHDGSAQNLGNKWTAQDAMGFSLTYYNNGSTIRDYKSVVAFSDDANWLGTVETAFLNSGDGNLYNGNIRAMTTSIMKEDNTPLGTVARQYRYDQFQRLKEVKTWTGPNLQSINRWTSAVSSTAHLSQYSYDLNGNITRLIRRGASLAMDNLTYAYYNPLSGLPNQHNKLEKVTDTDPSGNYGDDLETQGSNNYVYDATGRLISDVSEGITITWTAHNKVKKIDKATGADVEFVYDALGRRVCKKVTDGATVTRTWYALDAQGEVMATYTQTGASPTTTTLDEFQIYGSQRLGTRLAGTVLAATPNFNYISETNRASAIIELKLSTFTSGQTVQYKLDNAGVLTNLNATTYSWNTGISIEANAAALMKLINANSTATDVTASQWWSNNAAGTLYMQLKFNQPGNWQGQTLKVYVNGSNSLVAGHQPKRALGYGTSKGSVVYGAKRYELANHLGNVLAVITDRKWGIDDGVYNTSTGVKTSSTPDGYTDYYFPTVVSYADYDPFGTIQTTRSGGSTEYKYGFQGQESEDEIKGEGNYINFEYRGYDPRIGRFFAIDPLTYKYPHYTPYSFSGNKLIAFRELEGLEEAPATGNNTQGLKWNAQGGYFYDTRGVTVNGSKGVSCLQVVRYDMVGKPIVPFALQPDFVPPPWFWNAAAGVVLSVPGIIMIEVFGVGYILQEIAEEAVGFPIFPDPLDAVQHGMRKQLTPAPSVPKPVSPLKVLPTDDLVTKKFKRQAYVKQQMGDAYTKYDANISIDFNQPVWNQTLGPETKNIVQWRDPSNPNAGAFYTFDGVDPQTLGIPATYTKKYSVTLTKEVDFLRSTAGDVPAFKPGDTGTYNGGGTQLFSTEAAGNATFTPLN